MAEIDHVVGENITKFRGEMSQAELARRMTERGFKWSQTTVWEVEKGKRPLKLSEAHELADEFSVHIEFLFSYPADLYLQKQLFDAYDKLREAALRTGEALHDYDKAQSSLGWAIAALKDAEGKFMDEEDRERLTSSFGELRYIPASEAIVRFTNEDAKVRERREMFTVRFAKRHLGTEKA